MTTTTTCWCGNALLLNYSPDYSFCDKCNSLVRKIWPDEEPAHAAPDHFGRVPADLKEDDLRARLQKDMSTFIPRALGALLNYCLPPASVLELGSAHGGLVAVLCAAGYDATGFEADASLGEFAKKTFDVQLLQGELESQKIEKGSLDAVVAMNSLERMENPAATMRLVLELLKPGGILLLQTPCFDPEKTFEELVRTDHPILPNFDEPARLRFFSTQSLEKFFHELGWNVACEAPMLFGEYNMLAIVSQGEVSALSQEEREKALTTSLSRMLTLALVTARATADEMQFHAEGRQKTIQEQVAGLENLRIVIQEQATGLESLHNVIQEQAAGLESLHNIIQEQAAGLESLHNVIQEQATELDALRSAAQERLDIIQAQGAELDMLRSVAQERLDLIQKLDEALKNTIRK